MHPDQVAREEIRHRTQQGSIQKPPPPQIDKQEPTRIPMPPETSSPDSQTNF